MDVLVLGPLEVRQDGVPVPVRRGRPRRLLLSLLLQRGGAVAPDTLVDQLWGDARPVNADNALQLLVSSLRRVGVRVERTTAGYRLLVGPEDVDAFRFERLVRGAQATAGPAERARLTAEALGLWRGTPFAEAAEDDFARGEVTRLEELRLTAEELRFEALLALGGAAEALPDLGRAVGAWPFRERFAALHALALYRTGRQADALAALDRTRAVLAEELGLDPGPELRRLEERILRQDPGLDLPRAAAPAGPAPLPATSAEPSLPAPVPVPLTALVGRDEELSRLRQALGSRRLVTLTGPGGAGKSRLAAEVARAADGEVWWADLSGVVAAAEVPRAVAAAAAVAGPDPREAVRRAVGDRPLLLVLDTCEHVLTGAADLAHTLLTACPGLRVLATSRRPLGLAGELVRPVPPLAGPSATRLFAERAAAVRPGFVLDERTTADVARIGTLLDGLPLALELAAAAAVALSPARIADLLADRLRMVGGLRATIGWSYELLAPDEALFFARLSVFAGPFPVEAAVEVAGAGLERDGLELLLALVAQSLVAAEGDDRFRLLDTIRAYAAERLADDERVPARERHARWYLAFARDADVGIRGADQAGWLAELRSALPDLRAALASGGPQARAQLVVALAWYWSFDGAFAEASRWIETALADGPHDVRTTAQLRLAAGTHAESLGRLAVAERESAAAAAVFAGLGDARGEAAALLHVGTARWALGDLDGAAAAHEKAVALARSADDPAVAALALVLRARTALEAGDPGEARRWLEEAGDVLPRTRDEHLVALALEQSARCALHEGDLAAAERLSAAGAELFEALGYPEGVLAGRLTLGRVRAGEGDAAAATGLFRDAIARGRELGHAAAVAEALEALAGLALGRGDADLAARLAGHADGLRRREGTSRTPLQERAADLLAGGLESALGDRAGRERSTGAGEDLDALLARLP